MSLRRLEPGPADPTVPVLTQGKARLRLVAAAFVLALTAVSARLVDLTVLDTKAAAARPQAATTAPAEPPRADIRDRDGRLLARTVQVRDFYADPARVLEPRHAAREIHRVLPELGLAELEAKLEKDKRFVWIKRNLTPRQERALMQAGIPGTGFEKTQRRLYPRDELAAHVLGGTDIDGNGIAGIEKAFDERLKDGSEPLHLTLDVAMQAAAAQALQAGIDRYRAEGGAAIVMDADSGAIRAMVSKPTFNPNRPMAADAAARRNRATLSSYEMGSTMKPITAAMALEYDAAALTDRFDVTKPLQMGGFRINDHRPKDRSLTVPEVIMYSSNIGAAKMALEVGERGQRRFFQRLGLTREVPIALPETGEPLTPEVWRPVNTATAAYGHGISVTPLHLTSAVATLVNDGKRRRPHLRTDEDRDTPAVVEQVIGADTARNVRRLMRLVVAHGTGGRADVAGYLVGGKTGTAQKTVGGGYGHDVRTSFVGAFPMTSPEYVVFAMLDEPKGIEATHGFATAGWNAAQVAGKIIARIGPMAGIAPADQARDGTQENLAVHQLPRRDNRPKAMPVAVTGEAAGVQGGERASF